MNYGGLFVDKGSGSGFFLDPDPDPGDPKIPDPDPQHWFQLSIYRFPNYIYIGSLWIANESKSEIKHFSLDSLFGHDSAFYSFSKK